MAEPSERDRQAARDMATTLIDEQRRARPDFGIHWSSKCEDIVAQALAEAREEERKAILPKLRACETGGDIEDLAEWIAARDKGETT